jgi:hypothetical protein
VKARPRSVEREVANYLSGKFSEMQLDPVERIPVLGRTGPDLTVNKSKLAIDVKSRLEVPKVMWHHHGAARWGIEGTEPIVTVRLCEFEKLFAETKPVSIIPPKTVRGYLEHMAAWSDEHIPAIVLHRPRIRIANAIFVIREADIQRLMNNIPKYSEAKWQDEETSHS